MRDNETFGDVNIQPQSNRNYLNDNFQENVVVDILMASYNGEHYISDQIKSIQKQSFTNWRLLISDDCSSDATPEIIRRFAAEDNRIIIVSEGIRYGSAKDNFLSLTNKAKAPYVMFSDQDDVWLPTKVEKTLTKMHEVEKQNGDIPLLVFTDMKVVREDLSIISNSFEKFSNIDPYRTFFSHLLAQSVGAGCTMMVNQIAIKYMLKVNKTDDIIMHDWWFSLVASAFGKIGYIDEPTSLYRQHGDNEVGAKKYSPIRQIRKMRVLKLRVEKTVRQSQVFLETYRSELEVKQKLAIENFCKYYTSKGFQSLFYLVKSRCWKKGLRKVGQIIILFF